MTLRNFLRLMTVFRESCSLDIYRGKGLFFCLSHQNKSERIFKLVNHRQGLEMDSRRGENWRLQIPAARWPANTHTKINLHTVGRVCFSRAF